MNDDTFGFLFGLFIGAVLTFFITLACTGNSFMDDAIEANVAHYEVDPKTGRTEFVYDCPNCGNEK